MFGDGSGFIIEQTAEFGIPRYSENIRGKLIYFPVDDSDDRPHCEHFSVPPPDGNERIFLIKRGGCSFVQKVHLAQSKQASAVIIYDHDGEWNQYFQMGDDHSGLPVTIPSMIIAKSEGDKLVNFFKGNPAADVYVELSWGKPVANTVPVDFVYSPMERNAQVFLQEISDFVRRMHEHISFTPHFHVHHKDTSFLEQHCYSVNSKSYCLSEVSGVSGRDQIKETIRQHCIWQKTQETSLIKQVLPEKRHLNVDVKTSDQFWEYARLFSEYQCGSSSESLEDCSTRAISYAGISKKLVDDCMEDSQEVANFLAMSSQSDTDHTLLLQLNGSSFDDSLSLSPFQAKVCSMLPDPPRDCGPTKLVGGSSSSLSLVFWVFCFILLAVCLLAVHKKRTMNSVRENLREEILLEVRSQLQDYAPLN